MAFVPGDRAAAPHTVGRDSPPGRGYGAGTVLLLGQEGSKPFVWSSPCLIHSRRGEERGWGFHILPPLARPCLPQNTALGDFPQLLGPLSLWAGRAGTPSPSISLSPVQTVSCAQGEAWGGAWGGQLRPCRPACTPQSWVLVSTGLESQGSPEWPAKPLGAIQEVGRQTLRLSCASSFSEGTTAREAQPSTSSPKKMKDAGRVPRALWA